MQHIINKSELIDNFYRGGWLNNKRQGYGVQLFPDGTKFIGNWEKNKANGFGRLEYINGSYYEGNFKENKILEGKLYYYNGTYFEGFFDGERDLFRKGRITFRDKEYFEGSWNPEGIILTGYLIQKDKTKITLKTGNNLIREGNLLVTSKIIYYNKGIIYEGSLIKGNFDKKGFFYSNYLHPFYFESNYRKKKYHGRYLYHSFFYGFETEEFYFKGQEKGIWRYKTIKGYEYIGDTSSKKQIVRFPFLNKDYYEGDLSIWCDKIVFISGIYNMFQKDKNDYKQIRVINCEDITGNKDVKDKFNDFDYLLSVIKNRKAKIFDSHFSNDSGIRLYLDDGSYFIGHVINGFVHCPVKDFSKYFFSNFHQKNCLNFEYFDNYFLKSFKMKKKEEVLQGIKMFKGTINANKKEGFCEVVYNNDNLFKGFFKDDKKIGNGYFEKKDLFKYLGDFQDDDINGNGLMKTINEVILKGTFVNGYLNGLGFIKYNKNNLEYFGQVFQNMKNGKGVLKFKNNYNFEGVFKDDSIDTSDEKGRIICKKNEIVEEGSFVSSKDLELGIFEVEKGCYVFDFKNGQVKKTI